MNNNEESGAWAEDAMEPAVAARSRGLSDRQIQHAVMKARESRANDRRTAWQMATILAVMGGLGFWMYIAMLKDARSGRSDASGESYDAYYTAGEFVKKQIVGARTIPPFAEAVVTHEGNTYDVAMNVDGLNAFGGPVRQALIVEMQLDGDKWRLVGIHHK